MKRSFQAREDFNKSILTLADDGYFISKEQIDILANNLTALGYILVKSSKITEKQFLEFNR